ncbi:helix-turn-helix domain-containing protein [Kaistia terrae]|uniref:Helix-turn-helix domain-containing protein n=1 Tax=Kaistia terrae TaxID=537017 RepID=A0ABW0Q539_9HYPH|nr:helix-turn-helix transcriptional regulator [Kaistia terrae]MCX5581528.1 helix-turn-helix transcriptional regulator [Kaistia terrae]
MLNELTQEFGPNADEDLPEEVLAAIADGLSPLEAVRLWKRLSVEQLSERSGVSTAIIHGAEGGRELSPEAQLKLAAVLGVRSDLFVE